MITEYLQKLRRDAANNLETKREWVRQAEEELAEVEKLLRTSKAQDDALELLDQVRAQLKKGPLTDDERAELHERIKAAVAIEGVL